MAKNDTSVNAAEAERSYCQADARQDEKILEKIEARSMLRKTGCAFQEMILVKRDVGRESCLSNYQISTLAAMGDVCFQHALNSKFIRCRLCDQDIETIRWYSHPQYKCDHKEDTDWESSRFAGKVNQRDFYMLLDDSDVSALVERHYNQASPIGRWLEKAQLRKKCLEPCVDAFLKACVPENGTLRECMSDFMQMVEEEHGKRQKGPAFKLSNAKSKGPSLQNEERHKQGANKIMRCFV